MNQVHSKLRSMALVTLVAGAAFSSAAMAATELDVVNIEGSRMVKEVTRTARSRASIDPIQEAKLTIKVSYADLDLSLVKDGKELEHRVEAAAKSICIELDKIIALGDPACAADVTRQAHVKVDAAILAASEVRLAKAKADAAKAR